MSPRLLRIAAQSEVLMGTSARSNGIVPMLSCSCVRLCRRLWPTWHAQAPWMPILAPK